MARKDKTPKKTSISRRKFASNVAGAVASAVALGGAVAAKAGEKLATSATAGETFNLATARFKTNVTTRDIEFLKDGSVAITSPGLVNAFVQNSEYGIGKLAANVAPVSVEDVSIDERGRIIISNPDFEKALREKLSRPGATVAADTNTVCKNAYKCGGAVKYSAGVLSKPE